MDVTKIQKNLKRKIQKAKKLKEDLRETLKPDDKKQDNKLELFKIDEETTESKIPKRKITPDEAKRLSQVRKQLQNTFKKQMLDEMSGKEAKEKEFKPITDVLKKVVNSVEKTDSDIKSLQIVPFKRSLPQLPSSSGTQTPTQEFRDIETQTQNIINLGPLPTKYLPYAVDSKFGIYPKDKGYRIGKSPILIDGDDIILNRKRIKGTDGLWRLLCYASPPDGGMYTQNDLKIYEKILFDTEAIYQNNDKITGKPKSSTGLKYKTIIASIWKKHKFPEQFRDRSMSLEWDHTADLGETPKPKKGGGLLQYSDSAIEYKYIDNLNELIKRLYFIAAEEQAGNNNFHNEKLGVIQFFNNEMEKLVDTPKGTEYLIRFVSNLPKKIVKGSGIINDLINNLPIPLHWPGYKYLGPGTPLDKYEKLGGVQPVNKLDEAAKEHDNFYKTHKDLKQRHQADYTLENKAWERVFSPDANIGEKAAAWVTTTTMKAKRHFGMGLK